MKDQSKALFENLFVLELANNHWGSLERGLKIIRDFGAVVRKHQVKASIKLQLRDVDSFIHPDFKGNNDIRYIKKTEATKLTKDDFAVLLKEVAAVGCIPMATPFDEKSVDMCVEFDLPLIKIASSDINDWVLLEKIASTGRPVIASTGGASEKEIDALVAFFGKKSIPLAINHCVSLYPSEDSDLCLHQIDYLKKRYPDHVIGFSTHEYHDWHSSMLISYAKGARTWERHIDIDYEGVPVSPYCSLPEQVDEWFAAFHKAAEMCGDDSESRRVIPTSEIHYLDVLVRGFYAKRDLPAGYVVSAASLTEDFYLAIPLKKGQVSCREIIAGETLVQPLKADEALMIDRLQGDKIGDQVSRELIGTRGI